MRGDVAHRIERAAGAVSSRRIWRGAPEDRTLVLVRLERRWRRRLREREPPQALVLNPPPHGVERWVGPLLIAAHAQGMPPAERFEGPGRRVKLPAPVQEARFALSPGTVSGLLPGLRRRPRGAGPSLCMSLVRPGTKAIPPRNLRNLATSRRSACIKRAVALQPPLYSERTPICGHDRGWPRRVRRSGERGTPLMNRRNGSAWSVCSRDPNARFRLNRGTTLYHHR